MRTSASRGDRRRRLRLDLVELPAHVAPTEGERDVAALSEFRIGAVAVDLQDAAESCEMLGRPRMLAVGCIDVGNAWRSVAGPGPLVACIGPQLAFLDAPASWIEHRRRRLVGEQLGRLLQLLQQPRMHRPQREGGAADPIGQGGAIERDALAGVDLRLAIEWRVVGVFGDQHMRDQCLGRYAVLDQPLRRRRLHHFAGARLAGILGAARHDHLELRRDHIEPLRDVLADAVLEAAAARAGLVRDIDDDLFARQMRRQRAAIDLPPARRDLLASRVVLLRRGVSRRERLLHVLQRQRQLLGIEPLGAAAEAMALQLPDDCRQPLELLGMARPLGQEQRTQCIGIGGEGISSGHRARVNHIAAFVSHHASHLSHCVARSKRRLRRVHAHRAHPRPVETFEQRRELRGGQTHHAVADPRPAKRALLQPLGNQHQPGAVPQQQLHAIGSLGPEHVDHAAIGIAAQALPHQRGEAIHALAIMRSSA